MDQKYNQIVLNGNNYPTWKIQCKMALMKDGLWGYVNGMEVIPDSTDFDATHKYNMKRDRALATIVLAVDPSLLYLLGNEPEDPSDVWKKLQEQFQKKSWANKLNLRRKLYSLKLKESESIQLHVKAMMEIFQELAIIGDPMEEEDRVVHLLASLPKSYDMLVTALEASTDVPKLETVIERLVHEERKLKENLKEEDITQSMKALYTNGKGRNNGNKQSYNPKCFYCNEYGHVKRNCPRLKNKNSGGSGYSKGEKVQLARNPNQESSSDEEYTGLIVNHALSTMVDDKQKDWIIDSGATCHMSNCEEMFSKLKKLEEPINVHVGDGHPLKGVGKGSVKMTVTIPSGATSKIKLRNVLFVPELSYNLFSVSSAVKSGKLVMFNEDECQIMDEASKIIMTANKKGNLFYLNLSQMTEPSIKGDGDNEIVNLNKADDKISQEDIWHQRYGHLGIDNLKKLAKEKLVDGFNFSNICGIRFCEDCLYGKIHKQKFPDKGGSRATEKLDLVHTDVCGKIECKSMSGKEYFLSFIDDKSRYVWTYTLTKKSDVYETFLEWKAKVERESGKKLKMIRSDNGGEYRSDEFETRFKQEGMQHQLTVPKNPEQNGVAERFNRTIVESVRSMLSQSSLPKRFWAEALATATYLRNRSPTKAVLGMTPYEAWHGKKPNVSHLRIFGSICFSHIPKDERRKLDVKAKKAIFVGYGTEVKGYRLFDTQLRKAYYSRDVIFKEGCFLNKIYDDEVTCDDLLQSRISSNENDLDASQINQGPHKEAMDEPDGLSKN